MTWKPLGQVSPGDLVDARLQLHHAAQVVATAGVTFLAPQPDDSHPNLGWDDTLAAFVGRRLSERNVQVGLRVADLTLLIVSNEGGEGDSFPLNGRTLEEAYGWLAECTAPAAGLTRAAYEIPDHAVLHGARFSTEGPAAFDELSRWFTNGYAALNALAAPIDGASEVRCWPHHFDLGSLIVLETSSDGSLRKSIGIGLSPGDESYAEPYVYVSPWPYPDADRLPALADAGHWHTDGHTSAILLGSEIVVGLENRQSDRLQTFLTTAVDASRRVLSE